MGPPQYVETYNPSYYSSGPRFAPRRRFGTSPTELLHLLVAVSVLTTAIVFWMTRVADPQHPTEFNRLALLEKIFVAFGIAVTGFALHEIGHKITAQHYGHWSEFRFSIPGLLFTLVMSYIGFLVGAPGATWHTATSPRDNGKISAAGPLVNLLIALIAFPLTSQVQGRTDILNLIADGVLLFNTILAAFNLIPIWQLDGKKILRWNPFVYAVLVGLTILFIVYAHPFRILGF